MKLTVNEDGVIDLKEVYSGISFTTDSKEKLFVCMRDKGFEINYAGKWYSLQEGLITIMAFTPEEQSGKKPKRKKKQLPEFNKHDFARYILQTRIQNPEILLDELVANYKK